MKKWIFVVIIVLGILFVGSLAKFSSFFEFLKRNPEVVVPVSLSQKEAEDQISLMVNDKKIGEQSADGTYSISVTYPEIEIFGLKNSQTSERINSSLQSFIDKKIADFKQDRDTIVGEERGQSVMTATYKLVTFDTKVLSIRFSIERYFAGAAHPNDFVEAFNYDVLQNLEIKTLEDIFESNSDYLKIISDVARQDLKEELGEDFAALEDTISSGTLPVEENFSIFTIQRNGLNIIFNSGQIGPYALGVREVKIPVEKFVNILKNDTGAAALLKNNLSYEE